MRRNNILTWQQRAVLGMALVLATAMAALDPATGWAQAPPPVDAEVEQALLAEDWGRVLDLLEANGKASSNPVARLIKGHACLALNRNNEAFCLFLSSRSADDLQQWDRWTGAFANRSPQAMVALYLKADAQARQGNWLTAIDGFNAAVKIVPQHPLVLNARGVAHAAGGMFDRALSDLLAATKVKKDFADAYCNLGALAIQQQEGAGTGISDFDNALRYSPENVVALYGRGCLQAVLGKWREMEQDFFSAMLGEECSRQLLSANIEQAKAAFEPEGTLELAQLAEKNPGMALESICDRMKRGDLGFQGASYKQALDIVSDNPDLKSKLASATEKYLGVRPDGAAYIVKYDNQTKAKYAMEASIKRIENRSNLELGGELGIEKKNGKTDSAAGSIKGSYGWQSPHVRDMRSISADYSKRVEVLESLRSETPAASGFKTGLNEASWDEGKWPFVAVYALCYSKTKWRVNQR